MNRIALSCWTKKVHKNRESCSKEGILNTFHHVSLITNLFFFSLSFSSQCFVLHFPLSLFVSASRCCGVCSWSHRPRHKFGSAKCSCQLPFTGTQWRSEDTETFFFSFYFIFLAFLGVFYECSLKHGVSVDFSINSFFRWMFFFLYFGILWQSTEPWVSELHCSLLQCVTQSSQESNGEWKNVEIFLLFYFLLFLRKIQNNPGPRKVLTHSENFFSLINQNLKSNLKTWVKQSIQVIILFIREVIGSPSQTYEIK